MSITITKVDGKVDSIHIFGEDVANAMKGIYELIDSLSDYATAEVWNEWKESKEAKTLYKLTREY